MASPPVRQYLLGGRFYSTEQEMYEGEAYIYSHKEVIGLIRDMAGKLLSGKEKSLFVKKV